MTFSILTYDQETGTFAGAAATGSLCVGGWVLRGDIDAGLVASQGTSPSTFWRDDLLRTLHAGETAEKAVKGVICKDSGQAYRQLIGLDRFGTTAGFTGNQSVPYAAHHTKPHLAVAGNMLSSLEVLTALQESFLRTSGEAADRLLAGLAGAEQAGGDSRGLLSAALLVLTPGAPPLDLRIDRSATPIEDLGKLLSHARAQPYAGWLDDVPVQGERYRFPRIADDRVKTW